LVCSHSQLSYISALGSRREQVQDAQVLDFMLWCRDTLANVVLKQQALPELKIQQKQQEIKQPRIQATACPAVRRGCSYRIPVIL